MATREVLFSMCDRCFKEVETDVEMEKKKSARQEKFLLPHGWLHISGNTRQTTVFEMDLCEDCKVFVIDAAGRGDSTS